MALNFSKTWLIELGYPNHAENSARHPGMATTSKCKRNTGYPKFPRGYPLGVTRLVTGSKILAEFGIIWDWREMSTIESKLKKLGRKS